jgi:hypothetical protein
MKLKSIAIASLAALVSTASFAVTLTEDSYIDGSSFVYTFEGTHIATNDGPTYSFTLNAADTDFLSLAAGMYSVVGGVSGAQFSITGVKLDGVPWAPFAGGSVSDLPLGSISIGPNTSIAIEVTGTRTALGSTFNGQLVLTPVPEPETYAMMLAGLAAMGFLASRRRNTDV